MPITPENKELGALLTKYLVAHSGRKINHLFWNIIHRKDRILCFVNQVGKDLNTINDPNTCVRFVKAKDTSEWQTICDVLDRITNPSLGKDGTPQTSDPFVIRVDTLIAYLKKIDFDLDQLNLEESKERSIYYISQVKDKKSADGFSDRHNHIAYPSGDMRNDYFMKKFKEFYAPILMKPKEEFGEVSDEFDAYMRAGKEFSYEVLVGKKKAIVVPVIPGADFPPQKFIEVDNVKCRNPPIIQILQLPGKVIRYVYIYRSDKMDLISTRVYLNYFLSVK